MSGHPQRKLIVCALLLSGCQSTQFDGMFAWMSRDKKTEYGNNQLAALNESAANSYIQPTSDTASQPAAQAAVAAARIEQLIVDGQRAIQDGSSQRLADGRRSFQEALALDSDSAAAHHGMAIVADLERNWPDAERHYKQALRQRPTDPSLLNDLGYSYLLQNRFNEAQSYLNQAIEISPNHEHAQINLALLSLKRNDRDTAYARLSRLYSPAEAQSTLARLEADLAQDSFNDISPANLKNASFEDVRKLAELERQRAQAERARRLTQAPAVPQMPVGSADGVNAPGQVVQPTQYQFEATAQNGTRTQSVATSQSYSHTQQPSTDVYQTPQQYVNSHQNVMPQQQHGVRESVPNLTQPGGNQQQMRNNSLTHTGHPPPDTYGLPVGGVLSVAASNVNGSPGTVPASYHDSGVRSEPQYQHGIPHQNPQPANAGLIQQLTPQQNQPGFGGNRVQINQTQMLGLNAGPDSLFPIGSAQPQQGQQQHPGASQQYGMPQHQAAPQLHGTQSRQGVLTIPENQAHPYNSQASVNVAPIMSPGANANINGAMYARAESYLPVEQHMNQINQQNMSQTPTGAAAAAQMMPHGYQALQQGAVLYGTPGTAATAAGQPNPLSAYQNQLRKLDSQYNQVLQEMGPPSASANAVQAQY